MENEQKMLLINLRLNLIAGLSIQTEDFSGYLDPAGINNAIDTIAGHCQAIREILDVKS